MPGVPISFPAVAASLENYTRLADLGLGLFFFSFFFRSLLFTVCDLKLTTGLSLHRAREVHLTAKVVACQHSTALRSSQRPQRRSRGGSRLGPVAHT